MSAAAECRARYSFVQQRQSRIKSLSCTKLFIDLGLSSPAPLPLPSLYASRLVKVCCIRHDTDNKNKEQLPIKRTYDEVPINEMNLSTERFKRRAASPKNAYKNAKYVSHLIDHIGQLCCF